jgi:hypothetical protein
MDQIPEWIKIPALIIGIPAYLFLIARWVTQAIVRSYFEVKTEFDKED